MSLCTVCSCERDDGACECSTHTHRWRFVRDWIGDPNVINGTQDVSFWECDCGDTTNRQPDGWEDPRELAAEARSERTRDACAPPPGHNLPTDLLISIFPQPQG